MKNEEFQYWISGYVTLSDDECVDKNQMRIILNHSNLVKTVSGKLDISINNFLNALLAEFKNHETITKKTFLDISTPLFV